MKRLCLALLACAATAVPALAAAGCSRPIVVPVSPLGLGIQIDKQGQVTGAYPALLREMGARIGCDIRMSEVPRARLEMLFEHGKADLLIGATQAAHRDRLGHFVPLIQTRPVLLSLDGPRPVLASLAEVARHPHLRLALVRGFDYGPAYANFVQHMHATHRLVLAKDPLEVARMLKAGIADATIMTAGALYGAAVSDPRTAGLADHLRIEPLDELPWGRAGVYLSRSSLTEADRALLESGLQGAARSGALYQAYKTYYPPLVFAYSSRPL